MFDIDWKILIKSDYFNSKNLFFLKKGHSITTKPYCDIEILNTELSYISFEKVII